MKTNVVTKFWTEIDVKRSKYFLHLYSNDWEYKIEITPEIYYKIIDIEVI